jgi:hypothetical protein
MKLISMRRPSTASTDAIWVMGSSRVTPPGKKPRPWNEVTLQNDALQHLRTVGEACGVLVETLGLQGERKLPVGPYSTLIGRQVFGGRELVALRVAARKSAPRRSSPTRVRSASSSQLMGPRPPLCVASSHSMSARVSVNHLNG